MTIKEESLTLEEAIAHLQQTEDASLRYYAAWWLGRFRVKRPEVLTALVAALEDESDRSPDGGYPLRRNAARALGKVGDHRAVVALTAALNCKDFYVREAAAQALEQLGDRSCVGALLALLAGGVAQAVKVEGKPHLTQPYEAVIEALGTLGAREAIPQIQPFLDHDLPRIQLAAARALFQLTGEAPYGERLVQGLRAEKLQLRRSALMDLGAINYPAATPAIAQTLAENSLKLISLRGMLNQQFPQDTLTPALSPEVIAMMEAMDQLL